MLYQLIGLILWTGIIFAFCFLGHRRKLRHDLAVHEINAKMDLLIERLTSNDDN